MSPDTLHQLQEVILDQESIIRTYYTHVPIRVSASETIASMLEKICVAAINERPDELTDLMKQCDERLLQFWAVKIIAKLGYEDAVNLLLKSFGAQQDWAVIGYCWGYQLDVLLFQGWRPSTFMMMQGFALGGHISEVNRLIKKEPTSQMVSAAVMAYSNGGHLNKDKVLKLITLTTNINLRQALAYKYNYDEVKCDQMLARAEKINSLMKELNKDYNTSFQILQDVEADLPQLFNHSITLFKQAMQDNLNAHQKQAVAECRQYGLTENIILDWRPEKNEQFSSSHLTAIKILIVQFKLPPTLAILEINHLNQCQVEALEKLYATGLRGHHLRAWQQKNEGLIFSDETLEKLLFESKTMRPDEALSRIIGNRPMLILN